ncbi:hypothetical protein XENTR_v10019602 [Xenopus tropicalis]|nr:hypothetical protein XENTR_v10019602 [Xenopus tropicalis]
MSTYTQHFRLFCIWVCAAHSQPWIRCQTSPIPVTVTSIAAILQTSQHSYLCVQAHRLLYVGFTDTSLCLSVRALL